jgi:hypothetical protein
MGVPWGSTGVWLGSSTLGVDVYIVAGVGGNPELDFERGDLPVLKEPTPVARLHQG